MALAALAVTGCAHNDVLVFGTDTKLALDVETGVAQGESPSITIGYKRKEAVWMPLIVNANGSNVIPCAKDSAGRCKGASQNWPMDDAKYRSTLRKYRGDGSIESEQADGYSVFASLGATVKGNASSSNPSAGASVGIAQFFATGNAAVNLTRNEALVTALKIDSAGADAQASAVVAAAGGDPAVLQQVAGVKSEVDQAVDCFTRKGGEAVAAKVKAANAGDPDIDNLTADNVRQNLIVNTRLRSRVTEACKSL
jgi:hypothetical protein